MSTFRFQLAVSLDGYVAGPNQSEENPLGVGGMDLHQWVYVLEIGLGDGTLTRGR